jgi:hypothetical protein
LAIAQNRQLELAAVGQRRQRLLELIEQSILLKHRLGVLARQQLVQELLLEPGFSCHTTLLSSR